MKTIEISALPRHNEVNTMTTLGYKFFALYEDDKEHVTYYLLEDDKVYKTTTGIRQYMTKFTYNPSDMSVDEFMEIFKKKIEYECENWTTFIVDEDMRLWSHITSPSDYSNRTRHSILLNKVDGKDGDLDMTNRIAICVPTSRIYDTIIVELEKGHSEITNQKLRTVLRKSVSPIYETYREK